MRLISRQWSGIVREYSDEDENADADANQDTAHPGQLPHPCHQLKEQKGDSIGARQYWLCDFDEESFLSTERTPEWTLSYEGRRAGDARSSRPWQRHGHQRGAVALAAASSPATTRGSSSRRVSCAVATMSTSCRKKNSPSLLALIWIYGRPVVVLAFALVGLALWRGGVRFGPLAAPPPTGRRSLAEQIRGTGQFVIRHNGGEALHSAAVRALDEAAQRRVVGLPGPVGHGNVPKHWPI